MRHHLRTSFSLSIVAFGVCVFSGILTLGFGGIGWEMQQPLWLILTIPASIILASFVFMGFLLLAGKIIDGEKTDD